MRNAIELPGGRPGGILGDAALETLRLPETQCSEHLGIFWRSSLESACGEGLEIASWGHF
eukprot:4822487-Pyramimonas_sp.AAC.1